MTELTDLDAYLARIGCSRGSTWQALHRAHGTTIPFENLDPFGGRPAELGIGALERKLVVRQRGGYCFEHNLLFQAALRAVGVDQVDLLLARVRRGDAPGPRPLMHLVLRVVADGRAWLADVGFGAGGLLDPIPLDVELGAVHDQSGWQFRLAQDGSELVVEALEDGRWQPDYGVRLDPVPLVDVEVSNWYTSTHPSSPFVTGLVAARRGVARSVALRVAEGTALLFDRPVGGASEVTSVAIADVPTLLEDRLGIAGVELDEDGRPFVASPSDDA